MSSQNKSARWYGVISLFMIVAISYIDRINISVLITDASFLQHIGLDPKDRAAQGFLATAFMLGYGLSAFIFTPFCASIFGVRKSLMYGLGLWGVVTFISPLLESYGLLLASRILLGISEGPLFSLAGSYVKAHFEGHENGKPNSFVNMGTGLGLALGYPLIGYMLSVNSWAFSFYALGIMNILIGIPLVYAFIKMPKNFGQNNNNNENKNENSKSSFSDKIAEIKNIFHGAFQTKYLLLITILTSAALAYLWGSSNWLPAYLKEARGFSLKEMGWLASLPQYALVVAVLLGGILIDKIPRRRVPAIFIFASLGVALSILIAIYIDNRYIAAFCLIAANFFWGLLSPAIPSTVQYYSEPRNIASAYGVVNGTASLVSGFMPYIMGAVISASSVSSVNGTGFIAGFSLLIGTQIVVCICGIILWVRERLVIEELLHPTEETQAKSYQFQSKEPASVKALR